MVLVLLFLVVLVFFFLHVLLALGELHLDVRTFEFLTSGTRVGCLEVETTAVVDLADLERC
jgi:hypothetical protein